MTSPPDKLSFFAELKRRKVFRVAITYAVVAWIIIQIAATTFGSFGIPEWAFRFVVVMLVLGFPIALIITWAFELTPDGVKLTQNVTPLEREQGSQVKRNWMAFAFASGLPTLIFGTLAVFFYFTRSAPAAVDLDKSIAVLPFRNVSAESGNEYFCDGVQEDILTSLANFSDMRVISRTSVMRYKDTNKPIPEIGEELGVSYILEGSVQRSGSRVRVTGQLINAKTDEHLWAKSYDRDLTDIFALQAEISKQIAESLKAVLTPEEQALIDKQKEVHPAAYDLVLKGRAVLRELDYEGDFDKYLDGWNHCEALFRAATAMDEDYVDAWVELAYTRIWAYFNHINRDSFQLNAAKFAIDRAVELDPSASSVLIGLGFYYYYGFNDYANARIYFEKALRNTPSNSNALAAMGYISRREGKWLEALNYIEEACRLDPNNVQIHENCFDINLNLHRFNRSLEITEHFREIAPDHILNDLRLAWQRSLVERDLSIHDAYYSQHLMEGSKVKDGHYTEKLLYFRGSNRPAEYIQVYENLPPEGPEMEIKFFNPSYVVALKQTGRLEDALRTAEEFLKKLDEQLAENPARTNFLEQKARLCALSGDRDAAFEVLNQLNRGEDIKDHYQQKIVEHLRFDCLVYLGEIEEALDLLDSIKNEFYGPRLLDLKRVFDYASIQDHPRFLEMLEDPRNFEPVM